MSALPQMLDVGPIHRPLSAAETWLAHDLATLTTSRPVIYTHRGVPVARLTPRPRTLIDAPQVAVSMGPRDVMNVLACGERGQPTILARRGIAVALLTPILEPS